MITDLDLFCTTTSYEISVGRHYNSIIHIAEWSKTAETPKFDQTESFYVFK